MHDKVYDTLRVQMAPYALNEDTDFELYCQMAHGYARTLVQAGKERQSRRTRLQTTRTAPETKAKKEDIKTTGGGTREKTTSTTTQVARNPFFCYNCQQTGQAMVAVQCKQDRCYGATFR